MATSFPSSLDSFTNPTAVDTLDSPPHDTQHADANDAIEALQSKVGVDGSAVTTSLDYKVANLESRPVETKTASYVLVAADVNKRIVMNNAGATTITVNDGVFAAGDTVWIHNIGAGTTTVTAGTATVNTAGSLDVGQWEGGSLYFTSASSAIFFRGGVSSVTVDVFLVAGGGGSGRARGGGGGAGGLITTFSGDNSGQTSNEVAWPTISLGTSYTLTVGAGGAGATTNATAPNGSNTVFGALTAVGGGGGASTIFSANAGASGGSGGGGIGNTTNPATSGGAGTANQGYAGGLGGKNGEPYGGGGGGGAGGAGSQGQAAGNGRGGAGLLTRIINNTDATTANIGERSGNDLYFAGGGGGGGYGTFGSLATGGIGGGGDGGRNPDGSPLNATAGTANTGGGGGGGGNLTNGTSGGSGVAILRFSKDYNLTISAGLTSQTFTKENQYIVVFTAGTGTVAWEKA